MEQTTYQHHPFGGGDEFGRHRRGGGMRRGGMRDSDRIYDGKRMRRHVARKFYDYANTVSLQITDRMYQRSQYSEPPPHIPPFQPFSVLMPPATESHGLPASNITSHFAHASTNKMRCPINVIAWTPEGRRLITGASTGEFTLWSGYAFNFETIQQAHDEPVRAMVWSHNDTFMVTADQGGVVKYWQENMNNLKAFEGHSACVRELSFSPSDLKFSSCGDDGTVKIWDFETCQTEKELTGHGSDVRCCDWHPYSSLVASGAKDFLVKLWDAKSGDNVVTLHGHKNTIFKVKWNMNGNWLLTCSRDQLIKVFDIRYMMKEMQTFRGGHVKEVSTICWHPHQETLFASGGYDGGVIFWNVGNEAPQAKLIQAHDSAVWDLKFHPLGHILASGSNDHTTKFWVRNRPGDPMRDKYNVSQIPVIGEQLSKDMYGIDVNALHPYGVNSARTMHQRDGRGRGGGFMNRGDRTQGDRHFRGDRPFGETRGQSGPNGGDFSESVEGGFRHQHRPFNPMMPTHHQHQENQQDQDSHPQQQSQQQQQQQQSAQQGFIPGFTPGFFPPPPPPHMAPPMMPPPPGHPVPPFPPFGLPFGQTMTGPTPTPTPPHSNNSSENTRQDDSLPPGFNQNPNRRPL